MAILCALSLRAVFGLTLRQTQGFLHDVTRLLGWRSPCRTIPPFPVARPRSPLPTLARPSGGPVHLAVDATGLKVYGEGEWKVRVHGKDKRRVWRKLHLAVDTGTGALHAHALTVSEASDGANARACSPAPPRRSPRSAPTRPMTASTAMPPSSPADARAGDPAAQGRRDPPATATPGGAPTSGASAAGIAEVGRDAWKAESGDHRRALAAPAKLRQETPIGPRLRAPLRSPEGRGRRRPAPHRPLHRPCHARKHQDRLIQAGGRGRSRPPLVHATTPQSCPIQLAGLVGGKGGREADLAQ